MLSVKDFNGFMSGNFTNCKKWLIFADDFDTRRRFKNLPEDATGNYRFHLRTPMGQEGCREVRSVNGEKDIGGWKNERAGYQKQRNPNAAKTIWQRLDTFTLNSLDSDMSMIYRIEEIVKRSDG